MILRQALSVLFLGLSSATFANQLAFHEVNQTPLLNNTTTQNNTPNSILSVFLYLPLFDRDNMSSPMARAQLTLTPLSAYPAIRGIYIQTFTASGTNCNGTVIGSYGIDNGFGNTVSLQAGHAYTTTDASNWALKGVATNSFTPQNDVRYGLLDATLGLIAGTTQCIQGAGVAASCTSATECGWTIPQSWTPP